MIIIAGAFGFLMGLVAHDIAAQGLSGDASLRPLAGTCPRCRHPRGWLKWRCPECQRRLEREWVVGPISGLMMMSVFLLTGAAPLFIPYAGFVTLTMALMVTDLEAFRIVDRLNLPGSALLALGLTVVAAADGSWAALLRGLGGAIVYFGGALGLFLLARGSGFGAGDVKLAPVSGLFTAYVSWEVFGWAVFGTALIGGFVALFLIMTGANRATELPYGPPMVIGSWLALTMAAIGSASAPS